jgi:hypothetical protein
VKKHYYVILSLALLLNAETLFEIKDTSGNKVLEVNSEGLTVLNNGDTIMVIAAQGIKAFIQPDAKDRALSRTFAVTTTASKDGAKGPGKVFEIATDAGATFYNPSDNTDEILNISKGSITANVNPTLNRDFVVNDQASTGKAGGGNLMKVSNDDVFETVNDSTMLWYKQKNAFRVGFINIASDQDVGQASFASGSKTKAAGDYSTALGRETQAISDCSFATGVRTIADGLYGTAMGYESRAQGTLATAFGDVCLASGNKSVAMGYGNVASGYASLALGAITISSGQYSTATGSFTTAQSYNSFVLGRYNIIQGNSSEWNPADPLFVVGNGSGSSSRSNAFEIKKNGKVYIPSLYTTTGNIQKKYLFVDQYGQLCVDQAKDTEIPDQKINELTEKINDLEKENVKLRREISEIKRIINKE